MARFIDTKKLGSGGFGEVWLRTRQEDGGVFAKKKLLDGVDDDGIARFQREVRLLSHLDHPNLVKVVGLSSAKAALLVCDASVSPYALSRNTVPNRRHDSNRHDLLGGAFRHGVRPL